MQAEWHPAHALRAREGVPRLPRAQLRHCAPVGALELKTRLVPRGPAAAVVLDDEQVAAIGEGAKRFPVAATINGYSWRSTVVKMRGEFLLGLSKATRVEAGVEAGDTVEVELLRERAERE